jgi:hypothetical protein
MVIMPLHLESFFNGDNKKIFVNIMQSDMNQADKAFATEDKKKILMAKRLFDNESGKQFGQIVYSLMLSQDEKEIEIKDVDIVLDSK